MKIVEQGAELAGVSVSGEVAISLQDRSLLSDLERERFPPVSEVESIEDSVRYLKPSTGIPQEPRYSKRKRAPYIRDSNGWKKRREAYLREKSENLSRP